MGYKHSTTVEQMMMNEKWDEWRRDELPKMHPEVAKAVRLELLTIMGMLTAGLRQWRHDMPKNSKRPVYRKGAMFEALFMDPDSELVARTLELVELQLEEEKRKLLT